MTCHLASMDGSLINIVFTGFSRVTAPSLKKVERRQTGDDEGGKLNMHADANSSTHDRSIAQQIDDIIKQSGDWRSEMLARLRALIKAADPAVVEDVKWKKPSRPEGVPVWSHDGALCVADMLKNAVRLTFPKGAQMRDPKQIFNARLDSKTVRAIDFHEGATVDEAALQALVREAVESNISKGR